MKLTASQLKITAWSLTALVVLLAILAWGDGYNWPFSNIDTYKLFPLFGLLAFSLMWTHYAISFLRRTAGLERRDLGPYLEVTSIAVLVALLLHPGLLTWQLWRDGLGLPPGSEFLYVGKALKGAVILGMISLFVFLAYELRRKYVRKPWWRYVQYASDIAMIFIFIHGLRLGGQIQHGWFRIVWIFYGLSLVGFILYNFLQTPPSSKKA
jgi:hypothetical protein